MKLWYVANARMPTEKAHGVSIAKMCEAFASAGEEVELVVPQRLNRTNDDLYKSYGVKRNFRTRFLFSIDLLRDHPSRFTFYLQLSTFYTCLFFFFLFRSRRCIVYTREPHVILLSLLGYKVVYECHHLFDRSGEFFALCRRAYRIVTISQALKRTFLENGFDERHVLVAPSGVDLAIFSTGVPKDQARKELGLPLSGAIALYTGNFTTMGQDKGIADIIAALKMAPDVLFVAAGGSEQDMARYKKAASDAGVNGRVNLFGHMTQERLALFQQAADVLLMPFPDTPHYREHMSPVKMFEYMASGRPIIASDLPTIREVLNEGNAIIVRPSDPDDIVAAVDRLRLRNDLARSLADQALLDVKDYSWEQRAKRVIEFLLQKGR